MAVPPAAAVSAKARLGDDRSQGVFRTLLDALSRPGSLVPLPAGLPTEVPPALFSVLALADVDVAVAVLDDGGAGWSEVVRVATGAGPAELDDADMAVALRPPTAAEIGQLRGGRADTPEDGARLFLACAALRAVRAPSVDSSPPVQGVVVRVEGPGVPGSRAFVVDGVDPGVVDAIKAANEEYPAGIDTWLVAADGQVVGLPRSSGISVVENDLEERGR